MEQCISFIHLSDIHFTKYSGDNFDIDEDLRNEISMDIEKNAKSCLKNIKGILVCGDIAFSAQESEYEKAQVFLSEICSSLSIPETAIYCVPGNHDVDQSIPYRGSILHSLQETIDKQNTGNEIDSKLQDYARDRNFNSIMFQHIEKYNSTFASKFGCNISVEKPNWQQDFQLDDRNILRLHGLNSIIISNIDDHKNDGTNKLMVIGKHQIPKRKDGVVYMSLCHHPPECWKDRENIHNSINDRVKIQLYGHKHMQEIKMVNGCLIVGSGATHPSRLESDWNPRYNWISIESIVTNRQKKLKIKIYERILNKDGTKFVADLDKNSLEEFKTYFINLEEEVNLSNNNINIDTKFCYDDIEINEKQINVKQVNQNTKCIVYEFMKLPFVVQTWILIKYKLIDEEDKGKKYIDIIEKIIEKASESGCLDEFAKEIALKNK